jgi:hypothetical protein
VVNAVPSGRVPVICPCSDVPTKNGTFISGSRQARTKREAPAPYKLWLLRCGKCVSKTLTATPFTEYLTHPAFHYHNDSISDPTKRSTTARLAHFSQIYLDSYSHIAFGRSNRLNLLSNRHLLHMHVRRMLKHTLSMASKPNLFAALAMRRPSEVVLGRQCDSRSSSAPEFFDQCRDRGPLAQSLMLGQRIHLSALHIRRAVRF